MRSNLGRRDETILYLQKRRELEIEKDLL